MKICAHETRMDVQWYFTNLAQFFANHDFD